MAFVDPDEVKPASTGGGFVDPDEVKKQPVKEVGGRYHNIARTGIETVGPAAAGYAGFGAGMAAAAPVAVAGGAVSGPFAPIVAGAIEIGGGLGGALVASGAAQKLQDLMHEAFAPEDYKQRQVEKQQHPYGTFAAQTLVNLAGMSPKTVAEEAGKVLTKPLVQRATGAALQTGIEAGSEFAETGKVDPTKLAMSAVAGAAMPGQNKLGSKLTGVGESAVDKAKGLFAKDKPVDTNNINPPPGISKEEFVAGLEKTKKQKDSTLPLVETAIKDKATGEITRLGPKHPESIKASTIDTHDQGFVDEQGNFLDRKEAWNRATSTGQVAKDQKPTVMGEGLHSGDLRAAGDDRFKLANIPNSVEGIPIVENKNITRKATGEKIGGKLRRDAEGNPLRIDIDVDHLYQQFEDKPWTTPKVEGVEPLPANTFKTPQEWVDFVIQHEAEHVKTPIKEGQTKGGYEDQINKAALKTLEERKAATGSTGEPPKATETTAPKEEAPVDRTKTSPRDIKNEQEFNEIAQEIYDKHGEVEAVKFFEGYQEYKKTWGDAVGEVEKFVGTNLNSKEANERIVHNNTSDLKEMAGKDVDLEKPDHRHHGGR